MLELLQRIKIMKTKRLPKVDAVLTLVLSLEDEEIVEFVNRLFPNISNRKKEDLTDVLISAKRLGEPRFSIKEVFGS